VAGTAEGGESVWHSAGQEGTEKQANSLFFFQFKSESGITPSGIFVQDGGCY
jgi:hypothetical protein